MDKSYAAAGAQAPMNMTSRALDTIFEQDSDQTGRMTGLMRRIEDLADRVAGSQTESDTSNGPRPPQSPGYVGVLADLHATRDQIGERIAVALDRIERVL